MLRAARLPAEWRAPARHRPGRRNAVLWADVFGWSGLFIEGDASEFAQLAQKYAGTRVTCRHDMVTAASIDRIVAEEGVPAGARPGCRSISTGDDIYVWDALTEARPRVVVIEYNPAIQAEGAAAQPHEPKRCWDGSGAFGANLAALDVVAGRKGYRLAHTDLTGVNAFYVRDDLWHDLGIDLRAEANQNLGPRPASASRPPSHRNGVGPPVES